MEHSADSGRRRGGLLFLGIALVLLTLGLTVLKSRLGTGILFLLYWVVCFGFTALAMLTALLDAWVVRTRARSQQQDLFKRTLLDKKSPPIEDD
jgi:hypothetical protein